MAAPDDMKGDVNGRRFQKPKALAPFENYILTYRAALKILRAPSTNEADARKLSEILNDAAAEVIAQVE